MLKKAMSAGSIELPAIDYKQLRIMIRGLTPLIHNRFPESAHKAILGKKTGTADAPGTGKKKMRPAANPERDCKERTHFTPNGKHGFPLCAISKCVVATGMRNGVADAVQLRAAMIFLNPNPGNGDMLELKGKFTRREDMVRLATGVPDICWRPQFDDWKLQFDIRYNSAKIGHEQIIQLVRMAGLETGLGAWRPENKNGWAGTFEIHGQVKAIPVQ